MATAPVFASKARNAGRIRNAIEHHQRARRPRHAALVPGQARPAGRVRLGRPRGPRVDHRRRHDIPLLPQRADRTALVYMTLYVNELDELYDDIASAGRRR